MCGSGFLLLPETLAAKHRPALGGTERKRGLLSATRADGYGFLLMKIIRRPLGGRSLPLAELAAFRQVFELLVVEENLLPGGEQKILATVHTFQYFVLEFHGILFQPKIHNIACTNFATVLKL
jgi:hypothetical protein